MSNKTRDYGDLRVTMTSEYDWAWDDKGTGAARSVSFWLPKKQQGDALKPLGTYGQPGAPMGSFNHKRATLLVGQNPNTNPRQSAVARPSDYSVIWTDVKTKGKVDGSIWRPIPPTGYVCLGDVAVSTHSKPSRDLIWCVREDLVGRGKFLGSSFWDDKKSKAPSDVSCWEIVPESIGIEGSPNLPVSADTFRAPKDYQRPSASLANILLLPVGKDYNLFDTPMPEVRPDKIPSVSDQFDYMEQCKVTLPFHFFFPATDQASLDNISNPFCTLSRAIAWYAEGVWQNNVEGPLERSQRIKVGVTEEERKEMNHAAGVEVSSKVGVGFVESSLSLNYQFSYKTSSSYTQYEEKEVTESFSVPSYYVKVLFSKHIWIKAARSEGSVVVNRMEIAANDAVYFGGCSLREPTDQAAIEGEPQAAIEAEF